MENIRIELCVNHKSALMTFNEKYRISTELASLNNQNGGAIQKKQNDDMLFPQTASTAAGPSNDFDSAR